MRLAAALLLLSLSAIPVRAQTFTAIAFHDVVDDERDLGPDDITTTQLTAFFDWLAGNGWSPISLDDLEAARAGRRSLPPHPILLSFDDGYASAYTRVYPLLEAYRFPALFFLVGSWMESRPDGLVRYGDKDVVRSRFLSWDQAREMAASGLAEFGSHSYDLHRGIPGNRQGSMIPAATAWAYDPATGRHESDAAFQARVLADLQRSRDAINTELGKPPRALAWPYGRYAGPALSAAQQAGFAFLMSLSPEPADAARPRAIARFYPARTPTLKTIVPAMRFESPDPEQRRSVCLRLADIAGGDDKENDAALGHAIEELRRLGATMVVLDPVAEGEPGKSLRAVWYDSALLPVKKDFLSFAAWQMHSRAGVEVFLHLDLKAAAASLGADRIGELVREMLRAPVDGILLDAPGPFAQTGAPPATSFPWTVRAERDGLTAGDEPGRRLALAAWQAAEEERPDLKLAVSAAVPASGAWLAPGTDIILLPASADGPAAMARDLATRGWLRPQLSSRLALPVPLGADQMRDAQVLGASAFTACPATDSTVFSAARFPRLP